MARRSTARASHATPASRRRATPAPALTLTHLGAAGWEISDGQRVILLDPYLSRLRVSGQLGTMTTPAVPGDTRRVFGPDDELVSDTAAVDAHITRADVIVHSHSHFNHTLDMPYIARKTGAVVIGTESGWAGRSPRAGGRGAEKALYVAYRLELLFDKRTGAWVKDRLWHPSQHLARLRDGRLRMTLRVADTPELVGWVLSFGSGVQVVKPPELRQKVRAEAQKIRRATA